MKNFAFCLFFLFLSIQVFAQTPSMQMPSELWHNGKVALVEGDTLIGKIKYNLDNNIIQFTSGLSLETLSSLKVLYFEIFDEIFGDFRYFYSLPYTMRGEYERPIFFEVLFDGKLTLMAREYVMTDNTPRFNSYWGGGFWWPYQRLAFNFYFLDDRGNVIEYNQKRRSLLQIMNRQSDPIRSFIRSNSLRVDRRSDLVKITSYYNGLIQG
jgi:hypothetical protein